MLGRAWRWYQRCLTLHPVKTQVISSGILWGIGDVAAQSITRSFTPPPADKEKNETLEINKKRVLTTSMFGFGFVGPIGNFWYEGLDKFIKQRLKLQPKSARFVAAKVALDGLIFGPLDLIVFFSYMGFSNGKSFDQVKEDVKRDFIPAFVLEGGVWPIVQVANFRFVPVPYQLLYVNIFCLLDSAFLSWLEQQQDAPWKKWFASLLAMEEQNGGAD